MDQTSRPPDGAAAGHEDTLTEELDAARARHPAWHIRLSAETARIWCTTICRDDSGLTVDCGDVRQVDRIISEAEHRIVALRSPLPWRAA
jgi:hypothetical protein